tara:strand:+ start:268 stop:624 length:357 start_codon:yes stop_codon:yes gene_type:complete
MVDKMSKLMESLNEKEKDYVKRFVEQANKFLKYGREPDKEGYQERYDYGGKGDLTSEEDRSLYKSVGKKLIELVYKEAGNDSFRFSQIWRYGANEEEKRVDVDDPKYYKAYMDSLNSG